MTKQKFAPCGRQFTPKLTIAVSVLPLVCSADDFCPHCERIQHQDAEIERLRDDHAGACKTIADMHRAAVGEITGPRRGVVEDVEDVRFAANRRLDMLESAWGIIVNATDWSEMTGKGEWMDAASRWRDDYHIELDEHRRSMVDNAEGLVPTDEMKGHDVSAVVDEAIDAAREASDE